MTSMQVLAVLLNFASQAAALHMPKKFQHIRSSGVTQWWPQATDSHYCGWAGTNQGSDYVGGREAKNICIMKEEDGGFGEKGTMNHCGQNTLEVCMRICDECEYCSGIHRGASQGPDDPMGNCCMFTDNNAEGLEFRDAEISSTGHEWEMLVGCRAKGCDAPCLGDTPAPTPTPPTPTPPLTACDNSTGTCTISEDPHIEVFDGAQVSLLASSSSVETASVVGDQWLVRSGLVSVQARMANDDSLAERNLFVRAVAIGGAFLKGNTIVIGSLEDQVTWNGKPILQGDESKFFVEEKEFFVKATRGANSSLVQDLSKTNRGLTVEMPLGLSLVVNRLNHHINVAIKMPPQEGGQDGLCGNFNGIAGDDSMEMTAKRSSPKVLPEESLFKDGSFK